MTQFDLDTLPRICTDLADSFPTVQALSEPKLQQLRRTLSAADLLPRSAGRAYHQLTAQDAAVLCTGLALQPLGKSSVVQVKALLMATSAGGLTFGDALAQHLAPTDNRAVRGFEIEVSFYEPHAKIIYRDGSQTVFGEDVRTPVHTSSRLSAPLLAWFYDRLTPVADATWG